MTNVVLSTRNIDDFINDISNAVVKKIELWNVNQVQRKTATDQDDYITRKEAADILHITLPTLLSRTLDGKITGYRNGRRVLYKKSEVEAAMTEIPANQKRRV